MNEDYSYYIDLIMIDVHEEVDYYDIDDDYHNNLVFTDKA